MSAGGVRGGGLGLSWTGGMRPGAHAQALSLSCVAFHLKSGGGATEILPQGVRSFYLHLRLLHALEATFIK